MNRLDLTGKKFERLTVVRLFGVEKQRTVWLCNCKCGNTKCVTGASLKNGHTKSCGCLAVDVGREKMAGNTLGLGTKRTEESRAKISKALKGRTFTKEHCDNIRKSRDGAFRENLSQRMKGENNPMFGKTLGEDVKGKIRNAMLGNQHLLGHKHSAEARQKMSLSQQGDKNWNWQGGIGQDPYCASFRDEEYRSDLYARDGYRCQNPDCHGITKKLCHHHINYNKQDCGPENLITLCISCNTRANTRRSWHTELYQKIMREKQEQDYVRTNVFPGPEQKFDQGRNGDAQACRKHPGHR